MYIYQLKMMRIIEKNVLKELSEKRTKCNGWHRFLYQGDEAGPARVYLNMLLFFQKQYSIFFPI